MAMNTLTRAICAFGALISVASLRAGEKAELRRYSKSEMHMGVEFEVVLYASQPAQAEQAMTKAMARIAQLDKALSDYDPESELSKFSETSDVLVPQTPAEFPAVKLSDDLWNVLSQSQQISRASDGAFDVTIGPLTKLWRRARRARASFSP